jgi:hypothetical protein
VKYTKPALSFEQQANQLLNRGLQTDRTRLIQILSRVSYYRLSAYWHPFKRPDESFAPDTTLDKVWRRYTFDRQLRLLVMDAIERVEVAVLRTLMVEHHARKYGPFGYRDARNFRPEFAGLDHQRMVDEIDQATSRSREPFVDQFRAKYTSEPGAANLDGGRSGQLRNLVHFLSLFALARTKTTFGPNWPSGPMCCKTGCFA